MGFLQSYLRLPRYQRVLLGVTGVALGWFGPDLMSKLFLSGGKKSADPTTETATPSSSEN